MRATTTAKLAQIRLFLAPPGSGIQAPKIAEAWLVRTVPVSVTSYAFRELKSQGFPFLLVDRLMLCGHHYSCDGYFLIGKSGLDRGK